LKAVGTMALRKGIAAFYRKVEKKVFAAGYADEIAWQRNRLASAFRESDLLREAAWVVLCSGFRESIVRSKFDYISLCFCDWASAEIILNSEEECRATAFRAFRSERKINAIVGISRHVAQTGFQNIRTYALESPIQCFQEFPLIGQITAFHLAKNLGFDLAKPDRHLRKLSVALGYKTAQSLCETISRITGDPISVVDIVLWRFMTLSGT
jgi:hypothetical protein